MKHKNDYFTIENKGNELTDASINHFILALQYQKTYMELHKSQGTGLLRLVLNVIRFLYTYINLPNLLDFLS